MPFSRFLCDLRRSLLLQWRAKSSIIKAINTCVSESVIKRSVEMGTTMPEMLYTCSHVSVRGKQENLIEDLSLSVGRKELIALISKDESAGDVLKLIAGLYAPDGGRTVCPDRGKRDGTDCVRRIQYVPDDIVCYDGLSVKEFLWGMSRQNEEIQAEAARLLGVFGIDEEETLLEMTFEQNRLVSIIQAMMAKPELLLLNRPYNMLKERTYRLLLKEIIRAYREGTSIVVAAESFGDLVLPCGKYVYLEKGKVTASYTRSQLPKLPKVVTVWGGELSPFRPEKMKMLVRRKGYVRFLYRERNMRELAVQISKTGCDNFNIEEIAMEEELFHDYERWLS